MHLVQCIGYGIAKEVPKGDPGLGRLLWQDAGLGQPGDRIHFQKIGDAINKDEFAPAEPFHFEGLIDEVAVFDRALSQEEIQEMMGGIADIISVEPVGKLSTTWAEVKAR